MALHLNRPLVVALQWSVVIGVTMFTLVGVAHAANPPWTVLDERPRFFTSPNGIPQQDVIDVDPSNFTRAAANGGCNSNGTCKQDLIDSINNAGAFKTLYIQMLFGSASVTDWVARINQSSVAVTETMYSTAVNSGWSPGANALIFANEHVAQNKRSLAILYNGVIYAVIKEDCGNFLGQIPTPIPAPSWNLTGTINISDTNVYPTQTSTIKSYMRNVSGSPATFNWYVRYCWDACTGYYGSGFVNHASGTDTNLGASGSWTLEDTWSFTPAANTGHTRLCMWIAWTNDTGPGKPSSHNGIQCIAISQPTTSCYSSGVNSSYPAGQSFSVTVGASYVDSTQASLVWGNSGRAFYALGSGSGTGGAQAGNIISGTFTVPAQPAGVYTLSYGVKNSSIPAGNKTCTMNITIAYMPFFTQTGGDVAAGAGFCGLTPPDTNASVIGMNANGAGGSYYGAGAQLAVLALVNINSFVTSTNPDGSNAGVGASAGGVPGAGLGFANTFASNPVYGGKFYSSSGAATTADWCVPNYYASADPGTSLGATTTINPGSLANGNYSTAAPHVTVNAGSITADGRQVVVRVTGDVYIAGDSTYGAYSDVSQIPQFQLLVNGNIYIDPNVHTLSGFYMATGTIYTCGSSAFAAVQDYASCRVKQLIVNGALSARKVVPGRTWSSVYSNPDCAAAPGSNCAAESFRFSPELWLSGIHDPSGGGSNLQPEPWKYVTSLPPVL